MNLDKTYCASPTCQNKCGRKPTKEMEDMDRESLVLYGQHMPFWYAFFCDEHGEVMDE